MSRAIGRVADRNTLPQSFPARDVSCWRATADSLILATKNGNGNFGNTGRKSDHTQQTWLMTQLHHRNETKLCSLALGPRDLLAAVNLSRAVTNEMVRVISADLKQTNGPLNTMFQALRGRGPLNEDAR